MWASLISREEINDIIDLRMSNSESPFPRFLIISWSILLNFGYKKVQLELTEVRLPREDSNVAISAVEDRKDRQKLYDQRLSEFRKSILSTAD